jgi:hypothetical protein
MRGAILAAIQYEDWAIGPADAEALATSGDISYQPCHSRDAVGPMTGIISPSMPILAVEDEVNGTLAYSSINEGMGQTARFGAHGKETLDRLVWIRDILAPAFMELLAREGSIDLSSLMALALSMGDEMHMRNTAATCLLIRQLAEPLSGVVTDSERLREILRFLTRNNDQFFLNFAMAAAKSAALSVEGIDGCTVVTAMARNGVEFGIRIGGLKDRWFTAPANVVEGLFFPGFTLADANPDIGDSAIMETYGVGGAAMAASPGVLQIVGAKSFQDAIDVTRTMGEICTDRNSLFPIGALDGEGSPTGIDIRKVVETGIAPFINTAIAHRDMKAARMVGAGIARAPIDPFTEALLAFADFHGVA